MVIIFIKQLIMILNTFSPISDDSSRLPVHRRRQYLTEHGSRLVHDQSFLKTSSIVQTLPAIPEEYAKEPTQKDVKIKWPKEVS